MDIRRVWSHLSRPITFLVIPQARLKPLRWQCTTAFFLFGLILWSGVTIWAGYLAGRHVDYWVTKADNQVMTAKMSFLAQEMAKSRDVLDMVRSTDDQLRSLLSMSRRKEAADAEAEGGPTAADRAGLRQILAGTPAGVKESEWRRQISSLRAESYKRLASFQEISWYISNQRNLYHATPTLWPTEGQITSLFGYRFDPMTREDGELGEFHQGIDVANNPDTLICATADGTVRFSGWSHGYGQMTVIDHGYGMSTLYAHTAKLLVKAGERVARGQVIAYMGTTGRSTGAHLHYEVWRNDKPVNPMTYLKLRQGGEELLARVPARAAAL